MTKKELVEILSQYDDDMLILIPGYEIVTPKKKTMKTLKLLWNSLGIVQVINIIIRHKNVILLLLSPLLVAYILGYMFLILTSFILWKIPETIPIPFVGSSMFDRVLIILGVILVFLDIIDSKSKR